MVCVDRRHLWSRGRSQWFRMVTVGTAGGPIGRLRGGACSLSRLGDGLFLLHRATLGIIGNRHGRIVDRLSVLIVAVEDLRLSFLSLARRPSFVPLINRPHESGKGVVESPDEQFQQNAPRR